MPCHVLLKSHAKLARRGAHDIEARSTKSLERGSGQGELARLASGPRSVYAPYSLDLPVLAVILAILQGSRRPATARELGNVQSGPSDATEARAISTLILQSYAWVLEGSRRGDCTLFRPQVLYFQFNSRLDSPETN
jgi:hypothetical protein